LDVRGHFLMVIGFVILTVGGKWLVDGAIKWMAMILFEKQLEHHMRQRKKERIDYVWMGKKQMGE